MGIQSETGVWLLRVWSSLCWLWKTTRLDEPPILADHTEVRYPLNQTLLHRTIITFVIISALLILPLERILVFAFLFGHLGNSCHFLKHCTKSGNSILRRGHKLYDCHPIKDTPHPHGRRRHSHYSDGRRKHFVRDKEYPPLFHPRTRRIHTSPRSSLLIEPEKRSLP